MTNRNDPQMDPAPIDQPLTRQQAEQLEADEVIDRQQDVAGRRESAGQPGGEEETEGNQGRNLQQKNAARPGDDLPQQTQQQQRQTPTSSQHASTDRKEG